MDGLFEGASAAFRAGKLGLARKAYGSLLHAIWDGGEVAEQLPGEDPPGSLETDLAEATACYLRALDCLLSAGAVRGHSGAPASRSAAG